MRLFGEASKQGGEGDDAEWDGSPSSPATADVWDDDGDAGKDAWDDDSPKLTAAPSPTSPGRSPSGNMFSLSLNSPVARAAKPAVIVATSPKPRPGKI